MLLTILVVTLLISAELVFVSSANRLTLSAITASPRIEIRVLCSHCPYYAEEGRILHCLANHGTIKLWKYHPEPMRFWEKLGFLGGIIFFLYFQ